MEETKKGTSEIVKQGSIYGTTLRCAFTSKENKLDGKKYANMWS